MNRKPFRLSKKALFGITVLAAVGALPVEAATIFVTTTADEDGTEASSSCSLREAVMSVNKTEQIGGCVAAAGTGILGIDDRIELPAGVYTLDKFGPDEYPLSIAPASPDYMVLVNAPNAAVGDLDITRSVAIVGDGSGVTTIQWSTAEGVVRDRIFHVFVSSVEALAVDVAISGVKLTQGRTIGDGPWDDGDTSATTNYYLRRGGGALAVGPASAIVLIDSSITGQDSATDHGGTRRPDTPDEGGATFTLALNDVVVDGNHADGDGGGIYNSAPMVATNIVVSNNDNITNGGGIYNEGNTTITNSTISGNIAEGGGGIFVTGADPIQITKSTLSGNRAVGGGAVSGRSGVAINMVNSTISGNLAQDVGAGFYTNGVGNLTFVTIANNVTGADSENSGSGINTFKSGSVATTVKNVLLAGNKKGWLPVDYRTDPFPDAAALAALIDSNCGVTGTGDADIVSSGNNLSSDTTCTAVLDQATDINPAVGSTIDPLIAPLAINNGGATQTHALLAGSPALGKGGAVAGIADDQNGVTRETPPDIGAFELVTAVPVPPPTGGGGGGCAVGGNGRLDPTLPAMLAAALAFFGWRRRKVE